MGCGAGRRFGDGQRHAPAAGDRGAAQLRHQGAEGGGPLRSLSTERWPQPRLGPPAYIQDGQMSSARLCYAAIFTLYSCL